MDGFATYWAQTDGIGRAVALLLLAMSISAWVVIFWKGWVLRRAARDIVRGTAAFWAAPTLDTARVRLAAIDREGVLAPLVDAATHRPGQGTLQASGHLEFGQVLLASVGATAPFVGLFGTVWGIYHALLSIAAAGTITIEKVSGPVGEALIMTAAGLAVAIPAVLAYNIYGKWVAASEADLEGFAHDLREMVLDESRES
jgi:biopolymer transport protein ExbB